MKQLGNFVDPHVKSKVIPDDTHQDCTNRVS